MSDPTPIQEHQRPDESAEDTIHPQLPLLSLTSGVVLPSMTITVALESAEAKAAVAAAKDAGTPLILVPKVDDRFASVGTVATIDDFGRLPSGARAVVISGIRRARIGVAVPSTGDALWVTVAETPEPETNERIEELAREYRATVESILELRGADHLVEMLRGIPDPDALADSAAYSPDLTLAQRVELLETVDLEARIELALGWQRRSLEELTLKKRIQHDVNEGMEANQREFLLRQQMESIRKELGDGDDDLVGEFREQLAELSVSESVRTAISKELDRFERLSEQSPEHGWIRTWLDTVFELPWGETSSDNLDLADAQAILDSDHTGLDDVKERIIEYLAVRKLRADRGRDDAATSPGGRASTGTILALVGPPGVGKTSLGASIARALDREYVRIALGGVRDEAEIRGHRRTYVGAQAGRLVRALQDAGTMNPVVVLDEIDKIASDYRGDPTSALLEVLDPAQNHTFRDHYLDLDLDLSQVLFIATANELATIPGPLRDRMAIINLDGYTDAEKAAIAKDHLLRRQIEQAGLESDEFELSDEAIAAIIDGWTREAGVRGLEREIGRVTRKAATKLATETEPELPIAIDADDLPDLIGRRRHHPELAERVGAPGVVAGLAVTGVGGDLLFVEAMSMPGEGDAIVTGQLGDVMSESTRIAQSFVRAHASELGLTDDALKDRQLHVHFPAGAVPKDGPSAGITVTTALVSLLTDRPVRADVAMTGEVTLQGKVLPIGGVKQKVIAAHRAGVTTVILPERNGPDLDDVPSEILENLEIRLVSDVREVLDIALAEPTPT